MIFIDTSGWYASEVEDDEYHKVALNFLRKEIPARKYGSPVTTDYVLDETLTLLRLRVGTNVAARFADKVQNSNSLQILWVGKDIFDSALNRFRRADERQKWSFTDCISFSVMEELSIKECFTFDDHFASAGFVPLPH